MGQRARLGSPWTRDSARRRGSRAGGAGPPPAAQTRPGPADCRDSAECRWPARGVLKACDRGPLLLAERRRRARRADPAASKLTSASPAPRRRRSRGCRRLVRQGTRTGSRSLEPTPRPTSSPLPSRPATSCSSAPLPRTPATRRQHPRGTSARCSHSACTGRGPDRRASRDPESRALPHPVLDMADRPSTRRRGRHEGECLGRQGRSGPAGSRTGCRGQSRRARDASARGGSDGPVSAKAKITSHHNDAQAKIPNLKQA
jgi:hypothetical protein